MAENSRLRVLRQVPWLLGLAGVFYFLGGIHWGTVWKDFHYDPILQKQVPLVFLVAAVYASLKVVPELRMGQRFKLSAQWVAEVALSVGAVLYLAMVDGMLYVDDAGFILRYLDHFAEGCFFCFNVEDGPVFGCSSFVYGLLGGILTWTGLTDADGALHVLAYGGTFFTAFLSFRILRLLFKTDGVVLLFWVLLMTCNRAMAVIYNSGMEAPVHYSIVLAALLFFLQGRDRLMWLFMAIAVVSKLDAVPLVVVMGVLWAVGNWADLRAFDWHKRRYHDALLYGLVPVVVWIVFAWIVFGSPLPQSAFAKITLHDHATGSWFPFLEGFTASGYRTIFLVVSICLFLGQLGYVAAKREGGKGLVFGFGFMATLLLYYFFNPGERMVWYYVLPEGLLLLQLAVGLHWFWGWLKGNARIAGVGLAVGFAFLFTWTQLWNDVQYVRTYEQAVELERARVGDYLAMVVGDDDTLQAGHGLISRKAKGYVVDETGLNFDLDTITVRRNRALWEKYAPDWVVMHGYSWEVDQLNNHPYVLDTSFFDIETYGYPAWRIFRRVGSAEESAGTYFLQLNTEVIGDSVQVYDEPGKFLHVKAKAYTLKRWGYNRREEKLTMGLYRHDYPYRVLVKDYLRTDSVVWEHVYVVDSFQGPGTDRIMALTIPLLRRGVRGDFPQGERWITLEFEGSYGPVGLYDPAVSVLRRDP